MALYKVRKGNEEFSIQPNMIEVYSMMGYTIIKLEEVVVNDVSKEIENITEKEGSQNEN